MTSSTGSVIANDQIDFRELLIVLWGKKFWILGGSFAAMALAAYYAFRVAAPVYESSAILLPTEAPTQNQLGAAAALLGKSSNTNVDADLYQSLLTSRTVLHKLINTNITNGTDSSKGRIEPLSTILEIDTAQRSKVEAAITSLASSVRVGSKENGNGGILEVTFKAEKPWLAQQIGNSLLEIGQEELRLVRVARSKVVLSRLIPAVERSQLEWDSAARRVANYKDRNRSIVLPEQMLQLGRLEIEKSAKEQKYLLVRKEYELQQLEVAKAVPPMMVLDSANLPIYATKPNKKMLVILGAILGFMLSSCIVAVRSIFEETYRQRK